jgi:hypothetical protein
LELQGVSRKEKHIYYIYINMYQQSSAAVSSRVISIQQQRSPVVAIWVQDGPVQSHFALGKLRAFLTVERNRT